MRVASAAGDASPLGLLLAFCSQVLLSTIFRFLAMKETAMSLCQNEAHSFTQNMDEAEYEAVLATQYLKSYGPGEKRIIAKEKDGCVSILFLCPLHCLLNNFAIACVKPLACLNVNWCFVFHLVAWFVLLACRVLPLFRGGLPLQGWWARSVAACTPSAAASQSNQAFPGPIRPNKP